MIGFTTAIVSVLSVINVAAAHEGCFHGTLKAKAAIEARANLLERANDYSYSGATGPARWGSLKPEYALCDSGTKQTPINVNAARAVAGTPFRLTIGRVSSAKIDNLGSTLQVTASGSFVNAGKTYSLVQFHFHTPSEHVINGRASPMEVHFVTQDSAGVLSVAGFPINVGAANPLFTSVFANLASLTNGGSTARTGSLDYAALTSSLTANRVFTYSGSLTTPPCSEGVNWVYSTTPLTIDAALLARVRAVMGNNARPLQDNPASL